MKRAFLGLVLLVSLCGCSTLPLSGTGKVTVPNIVGLNVPQAAAALNQAGLRLGGQSIVKWDNASGLSPNTISTQSLASGSSAARGTTVDVAVFRSPNIALLYDNNELTVVNLAANAIDISKLTFTTVEGKTALFAASRWADTLGEGECGQIWSVSRTGSKDVEGCESIEWLTIDNPQEYFWAADNGVTRFRIVEDGVERAVCDAAPPGSQNQYQRCEAYVTGGEASGEVTPYVYFAYTTQAFAVINRSPDKWMATGQTTLLNYNPKITTPGAAVLLGNPAFFGNPTIVADITQLAPGQCLLLTSGSAKAEPPESCNVIAHLDLASNVAFWLAEFKIDSSTDDEQRQCPAATPEKVTICVMPR